MGRRRGRKWVPAQGAWGTLLRHDIDRPPPDGARRVPAAAAAAAAALGAAWVLGDGRD